MCPWQLSLPSQPSPTAHLHPRSCWGSRAGQGHWQPPPQPHCSWWHCRQQETAPQPAARTTACRAGSRVSPLPTEPPTSSLRAWVLAGGARVVVAPVMLLLVLSAWFWEAMSLTKIKLNPGRCVPPGMTQIPSPNPWWGDNAQAPLPSKASASFPGQDLSQRGAHTASRGPPRTAQPCWREITGQDADSSCSLGQSATSAALQQVLWVQVGGQAAPEPPWEAHEPQQKAELGMPITTGGTQVTQPPLHTGDKGQMV